MGKLRQSDLRALLEVVRQSEALPDLGGFPAGVLRGLDPIIPGCVSISYNELDVQTQRGLSVIKPAEACFEGAQEIFERCMNQHPLISHYARTRDGRALKISDFLSQPAFHRLELYTDFYRVLQIEREIAVTLPSDHHLVIGIAFNRERTDFSERERLLLDLLRPHLIRARAVAEARSRLSDALAAPPGREATQPELARLGRDGRILIATTRVGDWLAKYFPEASTGDGIRLPELLDDWVTLQRARFDLHLEVPPPLDALVLEQDDGRLVIRFLPGADTGAPDTLLLDERAEGFEPETLRALRLTRREAAVLRLVARGQTDGEIARELFVSPRTVEKHLAHIFAKLGTHSRAGAVARAFEAQLARARGFAA